MAEKIVELHLERDNDTILYVKNGDIWAQRRRRPGERPEQPRLVKEVGLEVDYEHYLYFVDADGDISRIARKLPGALKRKKAAPKRKKTASKKKPAPKKKPARRAPR